MTMELYERIRNGLDDIPFIDIHTHLGHGGLWQARDLADIVSYHWLSVELERAARGKIKANPEEDPEGFLHEALPYFPAIRNTVNHYAFMGIMRDLYGIRGRTITEANWQEADEAVRRRADDGNRVTSILNRCRIEKLCAAYEPCESAADDRCYPYEYAEYLYAVDGVEPLRKLAGDGELPQTADELTAAIDERIKWLGAEHGVRVLHVWPRGDWRYGGVDPGPVGKCLNALKAAGELSPAEKDTLQSWSADATAAAAARHGMAIQLFHGSIKYADTTSVSYTSCWNPEFLPGLAAHFQRHPDTLFDLFLATRIPSHEAVLLSRVHSNLMVSGAWWHAFTPTTLLTFFRDRLEMLPNTAWNAFYSDGYIVEWVYGKQLVVKNRLALALAGMVEESFLAEDDALAIARRLVHDNAIESYRLT